MNLLKLAFSTFLILIFLDYIKKVSNIIIAINIKLKK